MDIQRITDYMDAVDYIHYSTNIFWYIKEEHRLNEYIDEVRSKRKDFESCILEWCMNGDANLSHYLTIYKEKLEWYQKGYDKEFDRFVCSSENLEKNEIIIFFKFMREEMHVSIRFIDKIINEYGKIDMSNTCNMPANKVANVHYTTTFSDKKLKKVYDYLIENGHLEKENLLSDFIYFFTGRGKKVNNGLRWSSNKGEKVNLAFFLQAIIGDDPKAKVWKKAEDIFGKKGLAQSYSEAPETSLHARKISRDVQRLIQ